MKNEMRGDERILRLVGLIYDAVADPQVWPVFLEELAETVGGDETVLFAVEPEAPLRSIAAMTRFDPLLIDRYAREFSDNIWVRRADERFEDHEIRYSQGLASASELRRDRYYADFLSPAQVAHSFSIKIPYGSSLPAYLAGSRSERKAAFEENEGKVLLTLAPHIRRALELHRRVAGSMAHSELVDSLPVGVVFANEDGHLLWWNRYADSIFQMRDGLWLGRAGFVTAQPREGERLTALVRQASTLGTRTLPGGGAMAISRPSLRRSYAVLVSPLKKGSGPLNQAVVAVLVVDPERSVPVGVEQRLALQFGLTPAEARVAARLLEGKTVGEAANELSVSLATARTHVRSLLNKTGTGRQAELIRIFLGGPYLLDRDP